MTEGKFYAGGVQRFQREGDSLQEREVRLPRKGFEQKLHELRTGDAAEIARKYTFGKAVEGLLSRHNQDLDALTEEVCRDFIHEDSRFSGYHPALVRAVAEAIVAERQDPEATDAVKH